MSNTATTNFIFWLPLLTGLNQNTQLLIITFIPLIFLFFTRYLLVVLHIHIFFFFFFSFFFLMAAAAEICKL